MNNGHVYRGPITGGAWIDAADLKTGDRLLNHDASWAEIVSVRIEKKQLTAYNITVADTETFFVRGAKAANDNAQPVWVHNCDKGPGSTPEKLHDKFIKKGFEPRGPDPKGGRGGYWNKETGRSWHIDPGGNYQKGYEPPHVDVNYMRNRGPNGKKKRKLF